MESTTSSPEAVVWVRTAPELWLFVAPRHRTERVPVPYERTASLGHVVESHGIPLTEVGTLLIDDVLATRDRRPLPEGTIDIGPVVRPQRVSPHFVLDVHLGKLARRLRIVGIDTAYRNDAHDDELIEQAGREGRVLLTQDRGLLRRKALWAGAYVYGSRPSDQLGDVMERFAPPIAPWTLCTSCNGTLAAVPKREVAAELKPGTRRYYDQYARCRSCGRVYWRGAHAQRIDSIIEEARAARPGTAAD